MVETINRGPNVSIGSVEDGRVEPMDGPVMAYQGDGVLDPRYFPANKDGTSPARIPAFYLSPQFIVVDAIPSSTGTSAIAAAQTPSTTQGVALNLVTAVTGAGANVPVFTPGIPIVPFGATQATTVSAIDFGFATGTTTANSSSITVVDNSIFQVGQWLVIGGAGASAATNVALITQVASVSSVTTLLYVNPVAQTAINNTPIGQGNFYGNLAPSSPGASIGPTQASAFAAEPYIQAGLGKMLDPRQTVARNLQISSVSTTSGTSAFLVKGYDIYGVPMTELITSTATPGGIGKKAFKYIQSIAMQTTSTTGTPSNVGVGAGNRIGFAMRSNKWEYLDIFWDGAFTITNNGWTAAITTPATNTTSDVRGYQDVSSAIIGSTGSPLTGQAFNGANRITINQAIECQSMLLATPLNAFSLTGTTQV